MTNTTAKFIRNMGQRPKQNPKKHNTIIDTTHKVTAFQKILNLTNFQFFMLSLIFKCKC